MQLPLAIQINEHVSFDNFIYPDEPFLIESLKQFANGQGETAIFLWGKTASGKSHLLQAVCQLAAQHHEPVTCLPMSELIQYTPDVLAGMEGFPVVCIDDLQVLKDRADWQLAIFNLFNRVKDGGGRLLFSATASPKKLGLSLNDLVSRLEWGPVFNLQPINDEQKIEAIKLRAQQRGLELETDTARYMLNRFPRNLDALFEMLDKLDTESLIRQRRITIPFVREVFNNEI